MLSEEGLLVIAKLAELSSSNSHDIGNYDSKEKIEGKCKHVHYMCTCMYNTLVHYARCNWFIGTTYMLIFHMLYWVKHLWLYVCTLALQSLWPFSIARSICNIENVVNDRGCSYTLYEILHM